MTSLDADERIRIVRHILSLDKNKYHRRILGKMSDDKLLEVVNEPITKE